MGGRVSVSHQAYKSLGKNVVVAQHPIGRNSNGIAIVVESKLVDEHQLAVNPAEGLIVLSWSLAPRTAATLDPEATRWFDVLYDPLPRAKVLERLLFPLIPCLQNDHPKHGQI